MEPDAVVNRFCVGARGDGTVVIKSRIGPGLTAQEALNLAAWLVALSDRSPDHADFAELLSAIEST